MSVMLSQDLKGYARLLKGLQMFRLVESEFIQRFTELEEERAKQLYILYTLNVKSFNNRYQSDKADQLYTESEFLKTIIYDRDVEEYKNVEQVLKSLQFLRYQIEETEFKLSYGESNAIKWLDAYITDCQSYLLRKYTQYETAKWGL